MNFGPIMLFKNEKEKHETHQFVNLNKSTLMKIKKMKMCNVLTDSNHHVHTLGPIASAFLHFEQINVIGHRLLCHCGFGNY